MNSARPTPRTAAGDSRAIPVFVSPSMSPSRRAGIRSDTHKLVVNPVDGGHQVSLAEGTMSARDRDCVLAWQPVQQPTQPWLTLFFTMTPRPGFLYFLAQTAPPSSRDEAASIPREVMLLVDHFRLMTGANGRRPIWPSSASCPMTPADRFGLCLFHTDHVAHRSLTEATPEAIEQAVAWLKGQHDGGGTPTWGLPWKRPCALRRQPEISHAMCSSSPMLR